MQTLRVILAQAALQLTNSQQEQCRAVRAGYLSAMTAIMTERQALNSVMQVRICSPFLKADLICSLAFMPCNTELACNSSPRSHQRLGVKPAPGSAAQCRPFHDVLPRLLCTGDARLQRQHPGGAAHGQREFLCVVLHTAEITD